MKIYKIIYLSKQNLGSLDAFKSSNGVIIVNSQSSHSGLSGLASEGYTFLNTNNKKTLQAFCKGLIIAFRFPIQLCVFV